MNETTPAPKPTAGIHTTEFWLTAVSNIVGAVLLLLVTYGYLTSEEQQVWLALAQAIATAVIPLVLGMINVNYIRGRTAVKVNNG